MNDYGGTIGIDTSYDLDDPVTDATLIDLSRSDAGIRVDRITQRQLVYIEGSYRFMGIQSL